MCLNVDVVIVMSFPLEVCLNMDVVIVALFSTRGASQRGCCPCYFPLEVCLSVDVVYISILYSLSSCFYVKILVLHKKNHYFCYC